MAKMNALHRSFLKNRFGPRVTFDPVERKLYSHDIGDIPGLLRPLIGDAVAEAVVQPESEKDLVDLVL